MNIVEVFQRYLGTADALPPSARLIEDLGIDSLTLVTILFELADQLGLDLRQTEVDLASIGTVDDVVSLVERITAAR